MKLTWIREGNDALAFKLLFFFFWPFGAWLYCFHEPRSKSSYSIFFLFSLLLLWHMAPAGYTDSYDDFLGILAEFQETNISTADFLKDVVAFFSFSADAPKELYQLFLIWITKSFTDNYHFFFLLAAIPVAFLQLKSLRLITADKEFNVGLFGIIAMIMMILPRDIITVQNPRFATGFWLFVCSTLYCFSNKTIKIKFLLPLLLLPAIHSAMWPALILAVAYLVIPKSWTRPLEVLALISIPFIFLDPNLTSYFKFSILPDNIISWAARYSSDEAYSIYILHEGKSGYWWIDASFTIARKIVYILMAIQVIRNQKSRINSESINFYPFFLLSFFFINMIQFVPVLGERYLWMWQIFVFYEWFKTFHFTRKVPFGLLLISSSWYMIKRYGYVLGGTLAVNMPLDVFYTPLPYLLGKGLFW